MQLQGKTALVTGAGHRLGRVIALALAEQGCQLMIHYHRSDRPAQETRRQVEAYGVRAELAEADLSSSEGVKLLFEALDQVYGGLDLLVNSAAVLDRVNFLDANHQDWQSTVGLNLKGAYFSLQQAGVRMRARGGGAMVNISDTAAFRPWKRFPLHSISKAGLEMLTQVAALALAPEVRVNAVLPGPTLKPVWMGDQRWAEITGRLPLQRPVAPEHVAQAVIFLLKNEYITGHTLRVDGGALL